MITVLSIRTKCDLTGRDGLIEATRLVGPEETLRSGGTFADIKTVAFHTVNLQQLRTTTIDILYHNMYICHMYICTYIYIYILYIYIDRKRELSIAMFDLNMFHPWLFFTSNINSFKVLGSSAPGTNSFCKRLSCVD